MPDSIGNIFQIMGYFKRFYFLSLPFFSHFQSPIISPYFAFPSPSACVDLYLPPIPYGHCFIFFFFHPLPKTVSTKSYTLAYNHITDWKQILKKTSDNCYQNIQRNFLKFNNRKMSNVIIYFFFNGQRTLTEKSSKNIQMANKYIERYSTSYVIKV